MKTIDEMIAVMTAYKNGAKIESAHTDCGPDEWEDTPKPFWNWFDCDYRIAPFPISPGHNPDKLTEEQVGVKDGWRLFEADEIILEGRYLDGIEFWDKTKWLNGCHGDSKPFTYRTLLSRDALAIARGLKKSEPRYEPWTFETCPREGWLREKQNQQYIFRVNSIATNYLREFTWTELLSGFEYSLDGLTNWTPAGRRVEG